MIRGLATQAIYECFKHSMTTWMRQCETERLHCVLKILFVISFNLYEQHRRYEHALGDGQPLSLRPSIESITTGETYLKWKKCLKILCLSAKSQSMTDQSNALRLLCWQCCPQKHPKGATLEKVNEQTFCYSSSSLLQEVAYTYRKAKSGPETRHIAVDGLISDHKNEQQSISWLM